MEKNINRAAAIGIHAAAPFFYVYDKNLTKIFINMHKQKSYRFLILTDKS